MALLFQAGALRTRVLLCSDVIWHYISVCPDGDNDIFDLLSGQTRVLIFSYFVWHYISVCPDGDNDLLSVHTRVLLCSDFIWYCFSVCPDGDNNVSVEDFVLVYTRVAKFKFYLLLL